MCHSVPVLQHARFNPWQCTHLISNVILLQENVNTMLWLTETEHMSFVPILSPILELSHPDDLQTMQRRSPTPLRWKLSGIDCRFTVPTRHLMLRVALPSIQAKKKGPLYITQISTPILIRGNAATCTEIHWGKAVGIMAPQPLLAITTRIKLDYTIDYYSCNSTDKRFLPCLYIDLDYTKHMGIHAYPKFDSVWKGM